MAHGDEDWERKPRNPKKPSVEQIERGIERQEDENLQYERQRVHDCIYLGVPMLSQLFLCGFCFFYE